MKKFFIRLVFRPVVRRPGTDPGIPAYKTGAKTILTFGAFCKEKSLSTLQ